MKRVGIIILVLAVVGGGSWLLYGRATGKPGLGQVQTQPSGVKTVRVARDAIEATIDATGSVSAERTQPGGFKTSGTVVEVLVKQGDSVKTGQVLAKLDATDLELAVKQADASLQASEASLQRTRRGASPEDVAAARAAVASAEANIKDLEAGPSDMDKQLAELSISQARNQLTIAQANLQDLRSGPTELDKQLAELNISQAKNSLWAAQGSRDALGGSRTASGGSKASAEAQVANAEVAVTIAQLNRDKLLQSAKETALTSAQAQAANAEVALKTAQVNRDKQLQAAKDSTLASAQAQLAQAQANLAKLLSSPTAEDVRVAEAQVAQARVVVEIARNRLSDAVLVAPFDGQLVSLNLHANDPVVPAVQVGTLADLSRYHVDVSIDETQISQASVGQIVHVTLDAFPGQDFAGTVSQIDQLSTVNQGIVSYNVRVDLSASDLPVRAGMTAGISVVTQRKDGVLLVPTNALKRTGQTKYVEVLRQDESVRVDVTTGLSNGQYTEIVTGLREGDDVVVGGASRPAFGASGGGPFGGGGG